jgi:hypothetical protein
MGCVNANPLASAALPHTGLLQLADLDENKVTPGLLGFVVFALIGGATWFLMKNMSKQLKKIDFEPTSNRQVNQANAATSDGSTGDEAGGEAGAGRDPGRP